MKRNGGERQQGDLFSSAPPLPAVEPPPRNVPVTPAVPPPPAAISAPVVPQPAPAVPAPAWDPPAIREERPVLDEPPGRVERRLPAVLTVSELTERIRGALETRFARVIVRGEVSSFRGANARGHLYFSLKDAGACIDACIWASTASRLRFALRDGLLVVAEGSVDVYAPRGRYSLVVQRIEPAGEGALALAFQQLKERLTREGLMGENRLRAPRAVPLLPRRIGVVTSRSGAALHDFLRILHARHPRLSVLLADARVQGDGAAEEVCRALERLYRTDVDVIVVTRGGGSLEDLWTFNEELVARTIHASPVPVVSAVGHEIDFTIADFVADHRAPTPSAAAERLAPVLSELEGSLMNAEVRLRRSMERILLEARAELSRAQDALPDLHRRVGQGRQRISDAADRLVQRTRAQLRTAREALHSQRERLARQDPQAQLRVHRAQLQRLAERLQAAGRSGFTQWRQTLRRAHVTLLERSPRRSVDRGRERLGTLAHRFENLTRARVVQDRARIRQLGARLEAMSPLAVLSRGYSLTLRAKDGHLVRGVADVAVGDRLLIRLAAEPRMREMRGPTNSLHGEERTAPSAECQTIEATVSGTSKGPPGTP